MPTSPIGLPIVILSGTPFQRGFQHGSSFADRIGLAIARMREGCSIDGYRRAREYALRSWDQLQHLAPAIVDEISGMATGALCDPIDLYCHIGFEFFDTPPASGCSGLAVASPNGAILGQNWDAPPEMRDDLALFLHVGAQGLELAMVASFGTLGWVGQNCFGLALLTNDLLLDTATAGFPSQVVRRLVLAQRNVPAALDTLRHLPSMGGRCYLLGDRAGAIAGVELSPHAGTCVLPPARRIAHTNNALLVPTRAVENEAQLQAVYPSSRSRLTELERAGGGAATVGDLMTALSDRANAPDAVSKTVSDRERTNTAFSIIFDCGSRVLYLCDGPPADGQYQRFYWPQAASITDAMPTGSTASRLETSVAT